MRSKLFYLNSLHFFNDGFLAAVILFLPFIAKDLHFNLFQVGALGTSLNLLPIFIALPSVFLAEKFGNAKILIFALLLYTLAFVGMSFVTGFLSLFAILFAMGLGFGLFHPIGFATISRWSNGGEVGKNLGNFTAWGDAGRIIFTGMLSYIIAAITWQNTVLIYGVLGVLFLAYIYISYKKKFFKNDVIDTSFNHKFKHLFGNKKFIFAFMICALDNLASSPLFLFLPFLLLSKNIQPTFLSSFSVAFLAGNMFGKVGLGRWSDRLGGAKIFILTEGLMGLLIIFITFANSPWLIAGIAILLGVATRGTVPSTRSLVHEAVAESGNFERAASLIEMGNMVAAALAPLVLGFISNIYGVKWAFWLCAVFAFLAIVPAYITTLKPLQTKTV